MAMTKRTLAVVPALVLCAMMAHAEYNTFGIPDSAEIRQTIVDTWLEVPVSELRGRNRELHSDSVGNVFQVRMEETQDEVMVIVAPQTFSDVDVIQNGVRRTQRAEEFRAGSPGGWVLYRDKQTGKPLRVVWYFNADSDVFVQFRQPAQQSSGRCLVDLLVYGSYASRSVPVGVSFGRLYTASFEDVYGWTRRTIPWEKVTVQAGQYRDVVQVAETIRSRLDFIDYSDVAAYNEGGVLYDIFTGMPIAQDDSATASYTDRLTLSGAGFVKWVADGFIRPITGQGSVIKDLLEHTVDYPSLSKNSVLSQGHNLSFTLDWTRNLAAEVLSARTRKDYTFRTGGTDVRIEPFAAESVGGMLSTAAGYVTDTGYDAARLKGLLYVLAATEPSYIYLAAIRQPSSVTADEMVFNECAVLLPYFDDAGRFGCYVFEKGRQTTIDRFISRYAGSYVHLSRVKATDLFFPQ